MQVEGTGRCLDAFLRTGGADCPSGETPRILSAGQAGFDDGLRDVRWVHRGGDPSWGRTRVTLAPGLRSAVATEYGVFDYSVALEVGVEVPLWTGASIEARHSIPVSNSDDFDDGKVFGRDRHRAVTDRVLLHQAVPLGNGLSAARGRRARVRRLVRRRSARSAGSRATGATASARRSASSATTRRCERATRPSRCSRRTATWSRRSTGSSR